MAFRGQYEHSLDAKDRLTIPARWRGALADGVVLFAEEASEAANLSVADDEADAASD